MNPAAYLRTILTRDEFRELTRRSNARGLWAIASTWAVIAAAFAVLARWPSPWTFAGAVIVIGGRQLALAILMHEAAHRTLFESRFMNDVVTDWLCARPVHGHVEKYRRHHMRHHSHTATDQDPDLSLVTPFPTTRKSLLRKFARDLFGATGLKRWLGQFLMDCEVLGYTVAGDAKRLPRSGRHLGDYVRAGIRNGGGFVLANVAIAAVLAAFGHAWVYAAWLVADLTVFNLFVRIRSLAEHACTERTTNPLENTRTTFAGPLARATVAPFRVNFHLEHHLAVAVPYYRLPRLHALLRERGAVPAPPTYAGVLRIVGAGRAGANRDAGVANLPS